LTLVKERRRDLTRVKNSGESGKQGAVAPRPLRSARRASASALPLELWREPV
jgi:hypothetical protein